MESSEPSSSDCIYEDMNNCSPLTDDGYITSSSSLRFHSNHKSSSSSVPRSNTASSSLRPSSSSCQPAPEVYMNMELAENRPAVRGGPAAYEYVDIEFNEPCDPDESLACTAPPQLPCRNKLNSTSDRSLTTENNNYVRDVTLVTRDAVMATRAVTPSRDVTLTRDTVNNTPVNVTTIPRETLSEGLRSFKEQAKLEKEMILSFSAAVLDSNNSDGNLPTVQGTSKSRTFMNSAV